MRAMPQRKRCAIAEQFLHSTFAPALLAAALRDDLSKLLPRLGLGCPPDRWREAADFFARQFGPSCASSPFHIGTHNSHFGIARTVSLPGGVGAATRRLGP